VLIRIRLPYLLTQSAAHDHGCYGQLNWPRATDGVAEAPQPILTCFIDNRSATEAMASH